MPFFRLVDCFFKLRRYVRAYGELDPAEPFVAPIAIGHKVMLITRRIGTKANSLHSGREEGKVVNEDAELFMSRRDVAVPELRMKDKALFRPVSIQRLVGFEALIGEKGVLLLRFHERGVHVEGSLICGVLLVDGSD